MGEVFRAHDPVLDRDVAIKITSGKLSDDEGSTQRFLREAKAAAQLSHPNIVTIYDFGQEPGAGAYIVMELLEGHDLRELIEKGRVTELDDKLMLMAQILDGLAFAHSKRPRPPRPQAGQHPRAAERPGQDHRLRPGAPRGGRRGHRRRDGHALLHGPGAGAGRAPHARSPTSSRWARCSTSCSSGKRPFTGPSIPAVLLAVVHEGPGAAGAGRAPAARGLGPFLARALAKNPAARYADAGAMLEALLDRLGRQPAARHRHPRQLRRGRRDAGRRHRSAALDAPRHPRRPARRARRDRRSSSTTAYRR